MMNHEIDNMYINIQVYIKEGRFRLECLCYCTELASQWSSDIRSTSLNQQFKGHTVGLRRKDLMEETLSRRSYCYHATSVHQSACV